MGDAETAQSGGQGAPCAELIIGIIVTKRPPCTGVIVVRIVVIYTPLLGGLHTPLWEGVQGGRRLPKWQVRPRFGTAILAVSVLRGVPITTVVVVVGILPSAGVDVYHFATLAQIWVYHFDTHPPIGCSKMIH